MTLFFPSAFPSSQRFMERSFGPHRILMSQAVSSVGNEYRFAWTAKGSRSLPISKKVRCRSYSGVNYARFIWTCCASGMCGALPSKSGSLFG